MRSRANWNIDGKIVDDSKRDIDRRFMADAGPNRLSSFISRDLVALVRIQFQQLAC
ncbi:hypothetical protein R20943_00509 [Paraburkholderia aspalathi]|nr:hypothetical protein R20943_00509 [Paraburkholderia aspalathi]